MKYVVTLAGRTHEVVVEGDRILVGGHPVHAVLESVPGTPIRCLVADGRTLTLALMGHEAGRWSLIHRGEVVEVEVLDERTHHLRMMVGSSRATAGGGQVRAPMPGLVVRLLVQPGQEVAAGSGLVVLEAMKMENEMKAPGPGIVESIAVTEGQAVEKGALLILLGPPT